MSLFPTASLAAAEALLAACRAQGLRLATAESCTGGLIVACLTEIAGSSDVVDRGYVTYDNRAKIEMLGVRPETLAAHGAVSEPAAREMAEGALARSGCDMAIAVTGIAGPSGATPGKPVGLVHLVASRRGGAALHERHRFAGSRQEIRQAALDGALRMALAVVGGISP
jgi:nicotinamide-nucleotide amidase